MSQPNNFSSYGGNFGQGNTMMPNQGMMQPNMEWISNAMRNYNPQQQQQQQQMMPQNQNQGLNPMEFFAMANSMIMNNNMYRNPMSNQYMNLNQPMNMGFPQNTSGMMNPAMLQSLMSNSRGFDSQKFDDSFSQNMASMTDFYRMMNSGANTGVNATPMNVNMRKGTAESDMALPNRTEFTQGGFGSMNGLQNEAPSFGNDQNKNMTIDDLNTKEPQRNSNYREDDRPINPAKNVPEERGKFDWEDRPISSNFSKRNNNPPAEYEDENYDDPRGASQNSTDYAAREYKNPYDEVPISMKGKNKRFEDMLEEELRANPDAVGSGKSRPKPAKKTFLKRGQRTFLASAGARKGQKENISSLNDIQDDGISSGIPSTKNSSLKPNNNFGNQMQRGRNQKDKFEDAGLEDEPEQRQTQRSKEPKKFLTRGAGKGGGVGNPLDGKQRKTHAEEDGQERSEERSKSVNPKGGPGSKKGSERTLKTEKSQGQLKTSARQDLYPDNGPADTYSLEREYNLEKHLKKSPKGRKMLEAKAKRSPNYVFDEGNDSDGDYRGDNEYNDGRAETIEDGPAPVSNLVNKYFYAKGNNKAGAGKGKQEESEEEQNTGDENVQKFVNEKIEILNSEIAKFKLENERVKKIRQKHEEMLKNLNKDIAEWNKQKERDIKEFKDWKQEEMKKINNEKKLADRQQKTLANMPNRKEREEIENLKKQISKLMEDMQHKEKRAKLDMDRLKRQVKESEERNAELLQELRGYDQFRAKEAAAAQNRRGNYEDEEEQEEQEGEEDYDDHDDGGNKRVIEEEEEDEEQEGGSDENNDLQYDDIVVRGNVETNKRAGAGTFHSPKFMGGDKKGELIGNGQQGRPSAVKGKEPVRAATGKWSEDDYKFDTNAYFMKHFVNKNEVARIINQTVSPDGKVRGF